MMNLLLWFLVLIFLFFLDLSKIWSKKDWYEMWVFSILLLVGTAYGILFEFHAVLPDPNGLEKMIFEPIGKKLMVPIGQ